MNADEPRDRKILAETRYLRLIQEGPWTYAQRPSVMGAIGIIAVTDADRIILVEQYRIPVGRRVIELPAGLVGDTPEHAGESLQAAAARELLEETGYEAAGFDVLVEAASSAGLTDECVHLLLARGLRRVAEGGGAGSEQIRVHEVACEELPAFLAQQQAAGLLTDFRVYAAMYFLSPSGQSRQAPRDRHTGPA